MPRQKLTSDHALDLAGRFHDLAVAAGKHRFDNWANLTPAQRRALENAEWSLLNASSDMVTLAIGVILDTSVTDLRDVQRATSKAKKSLKDLANIKKAIRVATAAVSLGAAIASRDPGAIGKNTKALYETATASV